ncbi:uncharacterized protein [Apostichopus japonicus]|uniref:uncharacterized protein isoform X1 n=1 Tax=Stichopus japonicus TaxID=307972 RepID=UPI003AB56481
MQRRTRKRRRSVTELCTEEDPPGFLVKNSPGKGRGVFTDCIVEKGEFLFSYHGELISGREGETREEHTSSVFRYFFKYQDKKWCVDATNEPTHGPKLGRLVNHGRGDQANAKMVVKALNNLPILCLLSKERLTPGVEILYDYGLDEKDMPWMKKPPGSSLTHTDGEPKASAVIQQKLAVNDNKQPTEVFGETHTGSEQYQEVADHDQKTDTEAKHPAVLGQELPAAELNRPSDVEREADVESTKEPKVAQQVQPTDIELKQKLAVNDNKQPTEVFGETHTRSEQYQEVADLDQKTDTEAKHPAVLGQELQAAELNRPSDVEREADVESTKEPKVAQQVQPTDIELRQKLAVNDNKQPTEVFGETHTRSEQYQEVADLDQKTDTEAKHPAVLGQELQAAELNRPSDVEREADVESTKEPKVAQQVQPTDIELKQEMKVADQVRGYKVLETKIKDDSLLTACCNEEGEDDGQSDQDSSSSSDEGSEYLPSEEEELVPPSDASNDSFPRYPNLNLLLGSDVDTTESQETAKFNEEDSPGPPLIHVKTTSNSDGRKYNKKHVCFYCEISQAKLPRHLQSAHSDESAVRDWMGETNITLKNAKLTKIRNLGNHINNCKVLEEGRGELLVKYRPVGSVDPAEFVPCPTCYGYLTRKFLWKHTCPLQNKQSDAGKKKRGDRVRNGTMLLPSPSNLHSEVAELLSTLKNDNVSRVIKSDELILQFAKKENLKLGHDPEQQNYTRTKLREVARLLIDARVVSKDENQTLTELIHPAKYDIVVTAARNLAGFDSSTHTYKVPSLALKLGHSLKKCALIVKAEGLKSGDENAVNKSTQFHELCEMKWTEDISVHAHRTLTENKRNKAKALPLAEDVLCLTSYLKETSEVQRKLVKEGTCDSFTAWKSLNELTLTQVMLFNRRRQGEISKMSVDDYNSRCLPESMDYIYDSLSDFEKELCRTFKRVEIVGKKGRTVPVLLTKEMEESMSLLLSSRENVGVSAENPYMFPSTSDGHIRGSDCIRRYAVLCGATNPTFLRSTALRKQIATVSQVLNLKDNELDILAKFLGHDVRVHREFYRLPDSTLQVAKISKLLLSLENGRTSNLAGKSLDEIDIEKDEEIQEDESVNDSEEDEKVEEEDEQEPLNHVPHVTMPEQSPIPATAKKTQCRRRPWSNEEVDIMKKAFRKEIAQNKLPGKAAIEKVLEQYDCLRGRKWTNLKDFIRNRFLKANKE